MAVAEASVCPSHSAILSKRRKLASRKSTISSAKDSSLRISRTFPEIRKGSSGPRALNNRGVGTDLSTLLGIGGARLIRGSSTEGGLTLSSFRKGLSYTAKVISKGLHSPRKKFLNFFGLEVAYFGVLLRAVSREIQTLGENYYLN